MSRTTGDSRRFSSFHREISPPSVTTEQAAEFSVVQTLTREISFYTMAWLKEVLGLLQM